LCLRSSSGSVAAVSEKAADHAVDITVNGKSMSVPAGSTVASLLLLLGVERTRVAVEKNKDVVPKKSYDETTLQAGDRVEVVTFVGGG
jgi:thiamine biosynthesis protein ThiS